MLIALFAYSEVSNTHFIVRLVNPKYLAYQIIISSVIYKMCLDDNTFIANANNSSQYVRVFREKMQIRDLLQLTPAALL